jgi:transposase
MCLEGPNITSSRHSGRGAGSAPGVLPFPPDIGKLITELQARLHIALAELDRERGGNERLRGENGQLRAEIEKLKLTIAKLSKNSANSSKPSSSDIVKPKPREKPKKGKRKIGAQPGHPRHERAAWPGGETDEIHEYLLAACPDCHTKVLPTDGEPKILQQVELSGKPIIRHEHRAYPFWCPKCKKIHFMEFPPEIVREGLFKADLTALVAYMKHVCHASFSTIRKFIRDVLREKVSRGYLRKLMVKVGHALDEPYEELLKRLPLETRLNVDETGHKENGGRFWTWVFKADLHVLFKIHKSRGSDVLVDVLGKEFDGVLGCDYFSAYRKFMRDFDVAVQFCLAHLIRDIRFLTSLPDAGSRAYGQRLLQAVRGLFKVIHDSDGMAPEALTAALEKAKTAIMAAALDDIPSRLDKDGKELNREVANMAKRFRENGEAYFTFITTPGMDPTNNEGERAIRFVVIDRHVTQGTRSVKGRKTSERLWTVIATCALQGRSAYNFILEAVKAHFRSEPAPSLLHAPG